jgi:hypothetical protein
MARKSKEQQKQYNKKYHEEHRDKDLSTKKEKYRCEGRNYYLLKLYGITTIDWQDMFDKQEGKCAICGIHQSEVKSTFHVDHNHETNKVRGLLCSKCNQAIGLVGESISTLNSMIDYLKEF